MPTRTAPSATAQSPGRPGGGWGWSILEVGFVFLLFFVFAGSPPPDVGEAHYLAKARHYWDPAWCRGDVFLESRDAHAVFYWTFGWVTRLVSLEAAAWIGRGVTWLLLAWSWQRLSVAIAPQRLMAILTAGLMLVFIRWFHMAGEWIVGGVEAKSFAYALVFLSLESAVRTRWGLALLLAGGATAFHVLVGGWMGIAVGVAWLLCGRQQTPLVKMLPAAAGAIGLAAVGIVPALALSRGVDPEIASEANRIYVFERLSHHLVFHRLGWLFVGRQLLLGLAWAWLAWRALASSPAATRLHAVVLGSVGIALAGVTIDQGTVAVASIGGLSKEQYQALAAPLLKFYWFRLSDSLLAVGVALAIGHELKRLLDHGSAAGTWALLAAMLTVGVNLAEIGYERSKHRLPGSFLQPRPTAELEDRYVLSRFGRPDDDEPPGDDPPLSPGPPGRIDSLSAEEQFDQWRAVCRWIADNTPKDARFLTPRRQQTFKWYASRAEVASWKDVPQDAASLVAWHRTLMEIHPRGSGEADLAFHSDAELVALARKHKAGYVVIDQSRSRRAVGLTQVYPEFPGTRSAYAVYRVPPP
jgi:hypothetical protein